jgi:LacI family transcriptional regulator
MVATRQITIRQVAQEAGVSKQTVSRVLNNRPDVAPDTRQHVQDVIARLGYQPSHLARRLKQRSCTLGVVTAELGQYGPMRRLIGIEQEAAELGYTLHLSLIHQVEQDNGERVLNELLAWQVEGVIWAVPEVSNNRAWLHHNIPQLPVPVLFISERSGGGPAAVSVDNRAGGRLATEHLLAQGYQRLGLITGPLNWEVARQRQLGWLDALPTAENRQIIHGDWSAASGAQALRQLLQQYPELDAIFACNDQMALGVLQAAHEMNIRVPEDLALVGFDNTPDSAYFWPPLSSVRHQLIEQGRDAVQALIDMIETQRQFGHFAQPEGAVLQPQLVVRKSSAVS